MYAKVPQASQKEVREMQDDEYWRDKLTPEEYYVCREKGTERPFTGEYWDTTQEGVYNCRCCGEPLFQLLRRELPLPRLPAPNGVDEHEELVEPGVALGGSRNRPTTSPRR